MEVLSPFFIYYASHMQVLHYVKANNNTTTAWKFNVREFAYVCEIKEKKNEKYLQILYEKMKMKIPWLSKNMCGFI